MWGLFDLDETAVDLFDDDDVSSLRKSFSNMGRCSNGAKLCWILGNFVLCWVRKVIVLEWREKFGDLEEK